ncbi:MAG: HAD family phosphatase [Clostridia bacterium]|nr:HAD family phosphatase [Clostridia bacterium]
MIKLIATDLDGTLLLPDHVTVSEENIAALRAASEQGIKIVIASGRTHGVFSKGVAELDVVDFAIMSNGAAFMAYDHGRPLDRSPVTEMPYEVWTRAYDIIASAGAHPEIYAFGHSFMDESRREGFASPVITPALVEELKSHVGFVDDVKETLAGKSAEKICVLSVPEDTRDRMMAQLRADDRIALVNSIPGNVEVNAAGTGKGNALAMLCKELGIMPDEVMALGDAENDLDMLRFAGCSVAMGNASDEVKAVCRYVTDRSENHGVAKAVYKYAIK